MKQVLLIIPIMEMKEAEAQRSQAGTAQEHDPGLKSKSIFLWNLRY